MLFRSLLACAALALGCGLASAQPKPAEPTVEVRLRSINDLMDRFEYIAGLAGAEDAAAQGRELLKALSADGKGIEGIDPKRPIGAYATLEQDIATSPFVVMIPVADKDRLLGAMETRLNITPEKGEGGTYKIPVPTINELHMRFTNDYLYIAPKLAHLDPKALIAPKVFFAKDDGAVLSVLAHIDRVPADLKTFAFGQLEMGVLEGLKKDGKKGDPFEDKAQKLSLDMFLGGTKTLFDDGKTLAVRLFAEPKTDDLAAEVTLSAKGGSTMAKNFASLARPSRAAGIALVPNAAARVNQKVAATDAMKKEYAPLIDATFAQALKDVPEEQKELVKGLLDAVAPTLKAGEIDLAASLVGPDAKGRYQVIGAFGVTEGKGIEKVVKKAVADFGMFIAEEVEFKFDVETVGDFTLHRIDIKKAPAEFEKLFGTKSVWLATSDAMLAFSIEPDAALLKKGLTRKAVPAPVFSLEGSVAKLAPLFESQVKADEMKALIRDAFGADPTGKDTIAFTVEGGDELKVRFKMKGKTIRFFSGLSQLKK